MFHVMDADTPEWVGYAGNKMYCGAVLDNLRSARLTRIYLKTSIRRV